MKIKKDDNIMVICGKDKGKTGVVEKVVGKENKVVVTGINISKHHLKPSRKNPHGGILNMNTPIDISNVMIVCPHCSRPTKVGYKVTAKSKERICRKCQGNLEKEPNVKA